MKKTLLFLLLFSSKMLAPEAAQAVVGSQTEAAAFQNSIEKAEKPTQKGLKKAFSFRKKSPDAEPSRPARRGEIWIGIASIFLSAGTVLFVIATEAEPLLIFKLALLAALALGIWGFVRGFFRPRGTRGVGFGLATAGGVVAALALALYVWIVYGGGGF